MKNFKVSFIIPTFNEEKNIIKCLNSIFSQEYPKKSLEVIVVDDKSTDKTIEVVKKTCDELVEPFPVKILYSGAHHAEISKMIGFKKASGEYAIYLDADIELKGKNWIKKMLKPLLEDTNIVGSFTRYYSNQNSSTIERYLNFDPIQRDSIYQFFSPSIDEVISEKRDGYFICEYKEDKIPPAGLCLYRRKKLLKLVSNFKMFLELDFLVILVRAGFNKFAYVPEAGLYHHHASTIWELFQKRKYNLTKVYFAHAGNKLYTWFNLKSLKGIIRILAWVVYANLILPSILVGLYKSIKYKDWAGMYEPTVNLLVSDLLIFEFLRGNRIWKLWKQLSPT